MDEQQQLATFMNYQVKQMLGEQALLIAELRARLDLMSQKAPPQPEQTNGTD